MITEGEAWTREQLDRLRSARFRPAAVASFLLASQRRANLVRRARPEVARREATWAVAGAAAWLGLAGAQIEPFRGRVAPGLTGWAATMLMVDWHLGMLETEDGEPRNLGPADAATLLRAWLVPAVAERPTPGLCALGFATDMLDGPLARAGRPTRFGRDLEGLVDFAFTASALRGARRQQWLGQAAAGAETIRLATGIAYALLAYFGRAQPPDARLLRAARAIGPVRAAGLTLACGGHRKPGELLLIVGSAASVAFVVSAGAAPQVAAPTPIPPA